MGASTFPLPANPKPTTTRSRAMSHSIFHTRINEAQSNVIYLFALISRNLTSRQRQKIIKLMNVPIEVLG